MKIDRVAEINETQQTDLAGLATPKYFLLMPHLKVSADDALNLAIGLETIDSREFLTDSQPGAGLHKLCRHISLCCLISICEGAGALIGT